MMNPRPVVVLALVALLVVAAGGLASATTRNVPGQYATIQSAINAAVNGDVVVVAKGTYRENIDFAGKAITVQSAKPTDNTVVAATIIDGQKKGSVVTFKTNETAASVLRGFTLTNGSGTVVGVTTTQSGGDSDRCGGGVYCEHNASPALSNNVISGNSATWLGGGVYCQHDCSPALTSNTISGNLAAGGGGVYCGPSSSAALSNNTISGNTATVGGGVYFFYSSPTLANNTVSGNSAKHGGGVYCYGSSSSLTNNSISGNSVTWSGGGVDCDHSSLTLTNNTISGNSATGTDSLGGGVYCSYSSPALVNNTISGNLATGINSHGGGVACYESSPVIKNTIIAFSTKGGGLYVSTDSAHPSKPIVTYCDVYGNTDGNYVNWPSQTGKNGNVSSNPLFCNAAKGDFHEKSKGGRWNPTTKAWVIDTVHSPCIDAGGPTYAFNNEPAPNGGRRNMGAYGNTRYASKAAPAVPNAVLVLTATAASTCSDLAQITINLTSAASVQVRILNVAGREVAVLPQQDLQQGISTLLWNGRATNGPTAPAGRYLVRVTARGDGGEQSQALVGLSLGR